MEEKVNKKNEMAKAQTFGIGSKVVSMKRALKMFWHGLLGIIVGIGQWIIALFGMRDDSKYGKALRRIVGTCFAFIMLVIASSAAWALCNDIYEWTSGIFHSDNGDMYTQYMSHNVSYYTRFDDDGFVKTDDGKVTITGIRWVAKPEGFDSLACYSDGHKRGYFNIFTGEPVIKPAYAHAWVFSCGLASVDDGGKIKFINTKGDVVIETGIPYSSDLHGYVFENGYCILPNERRDSVGLIDTNGNWVLQPIYKDITIEKDHIIIDNGNAQSVLNKNNMNTIIPFTEGEITVYDDFISICGANNIVKHYDFDGNLIDDYYISSVSILTYTVFVETADIPEDDSIATDNYFEKPARCKSYSSGGYGEGLMSPEGKIITPPIYSSIEAIGYDIYLCKYEDYTGVILNGKGERVN